MAGMKGVPDPPTSGPPKLFSLMADQHGVASSAQAREVGVSRAVERRLVNEGALIRALPGIVAAGGVRPSFAAQAMAASLCRGVVAVSHGAAARLHRLPGFAEHRRIDVVGTRSTRIVAPPPIVRHYAPRPLDGHVVHAGAVPVTSLALTLVLLAGTIDAEQLSTAVGEALGRGVAAATIQETAIEWSRPDSPLIEVLAEHTGLPAQRSA